MSAPLPKFRDRLTPWQVPCFLYALVGGLLLGLPLEVFSAELADSTPPRKGRGFLYSNDHVANRPWSIHVLTVDRTHTELELHTVLGGGTTLGLATVSEQVRSLPVSAGKPMAAINGDFWTNDRYDGDPAGLQIIRGELISGPSDRPCFWVDTNRQPHITNVVADFKVTWPDGQTTLVGVNEERTNNGAVLFTDTIGSSTLTRKGREIILEASGPSPWLPLRAGHTISARVRAVRETGNSTLSPDTIVLSLSPQLLARTPRVSPGATLRISTETIPSLRGVTTAIGGGPALVRHGKLLPIDSSQVRNPRSAIGWNHESVFFVVVDGRQPGLSVGMSLRELADYMIKLGCLEAMNLDGGASSTLWVYGQVMNSPSSRRERSMANALVLTKKEKTQSASVSKE